MGKIRITGMNSGLDTDAMVRELVNAYEKQGEKYTKAKTKTEWKQEAWTTLNGKIKSFFSKQVNNMRFSSAYSKKKTTVSDSSKATVITGSNAVNGTQTLKVNKLAKAAYLTGGEIQKAKAGTEPPEYEKATKDTKLSELGFSGSAKITIGFGPEPETESGEFIPKRTQTFDVDEDMTLEQFAGLVSKAGLNANFDESTGRFFISSKNSGADNNFRFISEDISAEESETGVASLGSTLEGILKLKDDGTKTGAKRLAGEDAEIELNGATFTSASNSFSINGLTITAKDVTTETLSLVTDTDYDEIYDNIKSFLKEYNSLMNEMDKLYNAKSAKGYEPLTSEEKDAMTDDEIDKWETKIKDALLKDDTELDSISSAMRRAMLSTIDIDGTKYSLSSFGIATLGYFEAADNEKNAYHIDGDKDDAETSGNPDKLRAMIASNPQATASFFQQLTQNLYDEMNKISSRSDSYTSYGNFFSDKKLQNDYVDKQKQVDKWEKYVAEQEEKYYKQFTAMESAMSSLNSQQSYISQLFAG